MVKFYPFPDEFRKQIIVKSSVLTQIIIITVIIIDTSVITLMIQFLTTEVQFATTVKLFQSVAQPLTFYACYEPSSLNSFLFALNQTKRSLLLMLLVVQPRLGRPATEIFYVYMNFVF